MSFRKGRIGAMSLEYIAKFILILIAVAIAIGIIVTLSQRAKEGAQRIIPDEDDPKFVRIETSSLEAQIAKLASLIEICYTQMKSKIEDETCYIVRNEGQPFSITKIEIAQKIPQNIRDRVVFDTGIYDRDTIVIGYIGLERAVHVER